MKEKELARFDSVRLLHAEEAMWRQSWEKAAAASIELKIDQINSRQEDSGINLIIFDRSIRTNLNFSLLPWGDKTFSRNKRNTLILREPKIETNMPFFVEQEHIFWHVRCDEKRKVFQNQFTASGMGQFSAAKFQFCCGNTFYAVVFEPILIELDWLKFD